MKKKIAKLWNSKFQILKGKKKGHRVVTHDWKINSQPRIEF